MRNKFQRLKNKKSRTVSSNRWLLRHVNDVYVKMSKMDGYRSRSAYKLIEINDKFKLIKENSVVLDFGAAPGGWSQVIGNIIEKEEGGICVSIDLLPIESIKNVIAIQKDFYDEDLMQVIKDSSGKEIFDIVFSDMSPNTTGVSSVDHIRIMDLCERIFFMCDKILQKGGSFVCKIFQGGAETSLLSLIKKRFKVVRHFKPKSSRSASKEMYLIASGFDDK
jgi:23S rRNA (uridine2552-2'-O)-methyltransferase